MFKIGISITLAILLSACGGGSSDSTATGGSDGSNTTGGGEESTTGGNNANNTTGGDEENTTGGNNANNTTGGEEDTTSGNNANNTTGGGEESTTGGSDANASFYGYVFVSNSDDTVNLNGSFFELENEVSGQALNTISLITQDQCSVSEPGDEDDNPGNPENNAGLEGNNLTMVSAGEVITFTSPAGSYTELQKQGFFGAIVYTSEEGSELSSPSPNDLTLSIPGDQFPAIASIAMPNASRAVVTSPSNGNAVTANTVFNWATTNNPDSFINLDLIAVSSEDGSMVTVSCVVIDDGAFEYPADIKTEMGTIQGTVEFSRIGMKFVQVDKATLLLMVDSQNAF